MTLKDKLIDKLGVAELIQQLSPRDKNLLLGLIFFSLLLCIYYFVLEPSIERHKLARDSYESSIISMQLIQNILLDSGPVDANDPIKVADGQLLMTLVANSSRQNNLNLLRFQPVGDNGVNIVLNNANYSDLVIWLDGLLKNRNIRIRQAVLENTKQAGKIDARITIEVF